VSDRRQLARLAAPAAFLLAATVFVLLVRSGLSDDEPAPPATPATTTAPAPPTTAPATTAAQSPGAATTAAGGSTYVIQSGDTLETIAEQFGTTVEELVVLNPDVDPTALQIGQEIRVP
jgi:LysM repeat protein